MALMLAVLFDSGNMLRRLANQWFGGGGVDELPP
jgi:hypothetical protein